MCAICKDTGKVACPICQGSGRRKIVVGFKTLEIPCLSCEHGKIPCPFCGIVYVR